MVSGGQFGSSNLAMNVSCGYQLSNPRDADRLSASGAAPLSSRKDGNEEKRCSDAQLIASASPGLRLLAKSPTSKRILSNADDVIVPDGEPSDDTPVKLLTSDGDLSKECDVSGNQLPSSANSYDAKKGFPPAEEDGQAQEGIDALHGQRPGVAESQATAKQQAKELKCEDKMTDEPSVSVSHVKLPSDHRALANASVSAVTPKSVKNASWATTGNTCSPVSTGRGPASPVPTGSRDICSKEISFRVSEESRSDPHSGVSQTVGSLSHAGDSRKFHTENNQEGDELGRISTSTVTYGGVEGTANDVHPVTSCMHCSEFDDDNTSHTDDIRSNSNCDEGRHHDIELCDAHRDKSNRRELTNQVSHDPNMEKKVVHEHLATHEQDLPSTSPENAQPAIDEHSAPSNDFHQGGIALQGDCMHSRESNDDGMPEHFAATLEGHAEAGRQHETELMEEHPDFIDVNDENAGSVYISPSRYPCGSSESSLLRTKRYHATPEQLHALTEAFDLDHSPGAETLHALSQKTRMPLHNLVLWFKNRRARSSKRPSSTPELSRTGRRSYVKSGIYSKKIKNMKRDIAMPTEALMHHEDGINSSHSIEADEHRGDPHHAHHGHHLPHHHHHHHHHHHLHDEPAVSQSLPLQGHEDPAIPNDGVLETCELPAAIHEAFSTDGSEFTGLKRQYATAPSPCEAELKRPRLETQELLGDENPCSSWNSETCLSRFVSFLDVSTTSPVLEQVDGAKEAARKFFFDEMQNGLTLTSALQTLNQSLLALDLILDEAVCKSGAKLNSGSRVLLREFIAQIRSGRAASLISVPPESS